MAAPTARRFVLLDAMILIAATAFGLSIVRSQPVVFLNRPEILGGSRVLEGLLNRTVTIEPLLMMCTLAWLILALRTPRPRLRRLARRPGFVACCAATVAFALGAPLCGVPIWTEAEYAVTFSYWVEMLSSMIGAGVAASWALLALGRRWRTEPSWIDRGGRFLGALWIAFVPANLLVMFWYNAWLF